MTPTDDADDADDAAEPADGASGRGSAGPDAQVGQVDPDGQVGHVGDQARLRAATEQLADHVDDRWVEVADHVVARALSATRRSPPVRASQPTSGPGAGGDLFVSEQVLIATIRHAVAPVPGAAPSRIIVHTDADHVCTAVVIAVTVHYPDPIIPIADQIRAQAQRVLGQILGTAPSVQVARMHVHVSDVTTSDPHTGRPPPGR